MLLGGEETCISKRHACCCEVDVPAPASPAHGARWGASLWSCSLFCWILVLQRPWATTFWQTQCYRLAAVLLPTTLCWPRASPHPPLVSSTPPVSSSHLCMRVCVCVWSCQNGFYTQLDVLMSSTLSHCIHKLITVLECSHVCESVCVCCFFFFSACVAVRQIHKAEQNRAKRCLVEPTIWWDLESSWNQPQTD